MKKVIELRKPRPDGTLQSATFVFCGEGPVQWTHAIITPFGSIIRVVDAGEETYDSMIKRNVIENFQKILGYTLYKES